MLVTHHGTHYYLMNYSFPFIEAVQLHAAQGHERFRESGVSFASMQGIEPTLQLDFWDIVRVLLENGCNWMENRFHRLVFVILGT